MPFDFPATPAPGEVYTANGISYSWDGQVWRSGAAAAPTAYVKIVGDTMTGPLMLPGPNPIQPVEAAHKRYVDETVATQSLWQSVWGVAANVPDLDPAVVQPLHGYSWTAITADPDVPENAPASLPGIGGLSIASNDTVVWNDNASQYEHVATPLAASSMLIADAPPAGAFPGQQWFDSDSGKTYLWYDDGNSQQWVQTSGGGGGSAVSSIVPVSDTPPSGATQGLLWFDSANGALFIYYDDGTSAQWVEVGPP
jgi:hypothetical protein